MRRRSGTGVAHQRDEATVHRTQLDELTDLIRDLGVAEADLESVEIVTRGRESTSRRSNGRRPSVGSLAAGKPAPPSVPKRAAPRALPPLQDEWGFYDPARCGFEALFAILEAMSRADDCESR